MQVADMVLNLLPREVMRQFRVATMQLAIPRLPLAVTGFFLDQHHGIL
jgi:hypothetical protein